MASFKSKVQILRRWARSDEIFYWALLLPSILLFFALALYPLLNTIQLSFHQYILSQPWSGRPFVGIQNYLYLLGTNVFWTALKNTLIFMFFSVLLEFVIGFFAALMANRDVKSVGLIRAGMLLPWSIPIVVAALCFAFMYNDIFGIINSWFLKLHLIDMPIAWTGDSRYAMGALILADTWKSFPLIAFLLLAGLQPISSDIYEAAKVDGASAIQSFFLITIPLLKRIILIVLAFRSMQAIAFSFDMVYVLTKGGPGDTTQVLATMAYKYSFGFLQFGKGSAFAILTLAMTALVGAIFLIPLLRMSDEV